MAWLDSKGWAKRAEDGVFIPEHTQVLLREIEQLQRDISFVALWCYRKGNISTEERLSVITHKAAAKSDGLLTD